MVIRGGGLGSSMSRYLIERIEAAPNIELVFNTEVVAVEGTKDASLERVRWRSRLSGNAAPPSSAICSCSSGPIPPPAGSTVAA